jgi:hypothetical protein
MWEELSLTDLESASPDRNWRFLLVALIFVGFLGLIIYWQVRERIEKVENVHIEDVRASYELIKTAAQRGDRGLFLSLLSGADPEWVDVQLQLLDNNWLIDNQIFGLNPYPEGTSALEVDLNPQFSSAEVIVEDLYVVNGDSGSMQPIRLNRPFIFRRGDRWLWAKPEENFWGKEIYVNGENAKLIASFPARDEVVACRLAHDLDQMLDQICQEGQRIFCPERKQILLIFSHELSSVLDIKKQNDQNLPSRRQLQREAGKRVIILPSPSLIGLPIDEAGYQALLRGYGVNLIKRLGSDTIIPG